MDGGGGEKTLRQNNQSGVDTGVSGHAEMTDCSMWSVVTSRTCAMTTVATAVSWTRIRTDNDEHLLTLHRRVSD